LWQKTAYRKGIIWDDSKFIRTERLKYGIKVVFKSKGSRYVIQSFAAKQKGKWYIAGPDFYIGKYEG